MGDPLPTRAELAERQRLHHRCEVREAFASLWVLGAGFVPPVVYYAVHKWINLPKVIGEKAAFYTGFLIVFISLLIAVVISFELQSQKRHDRRLNRFNLDCPSCGKPLLDELDFRSLPSVTGRCAGCGAPVTRDPMDPDDAETEIDRRLM